MTDGRRSVSFTVNGEARSVEVEPRTLLSDLLRHHLGLTGTHVGCEQGSCGACTVLLDGRASVLLNTPTGEIQVAQLSGNALVGKMGILSDTPRSATIMAAEPTTALRIDKRVFLELLAQFPQMSLAVMRELAQRLERTNAQLVAQSS